MRRMMTIKRMMMRLRIMRMRMMRMRRVMSGKRSGERSRGKR